MGRDSSKPTVGGNRTLSNPFSTPNKDVSGVSREREETTDSEGPLEAQIPLTRVGCWKLQPHPASSWLSRLKIGIEMH
jgi:hypothetical protein